MSKLEKGGAHYRVNTHTQGEPWGGEGGALACPSASPYLPVVGAGSPVAVLGMAR
jgi:hypothetical protein